VLLFRKSNSLIVFQKIYTNGVYATMLKFLLKVRKHNTVYDIDDAEYLRFSDKSIIHFLKGCSKSFVGSAALLDYASTYNKKHYLLTSPVITSKKNKRQKNELLTVGWVGDYGTGKVISQDYSHKTNLKQLFFPAIKELNIPLKVILIGVNTNVRSFC
jgi:hypothetical protein